MKLSIIMLLSLITSCYAQPKNDTSTKKSNESYKHNISSFNEAKKILKKIYPEYKTFYCGCDYSYQTKKVDTTKCGYIPAGNYKGFIDFLSTPKNILFA